MQELLKKNQHFYWNEKHQKAFDLLMQDLAEATALAAPIEEGQFGLDTVASLVAVAGILHQEQEHNGPIVYGSKSLTRTQLKYCAPKLEIKINSFVPRRSRFSRCTWTIRQSRG